MGGTSFEICHRRGEGFSDSQALLVALCPLLRPLAQFETLRVNPSIRQSSRDCPFQILNSPEPITSVPVPLFHSIPSAVLFPSLSSRTIRYYALKSAPSSISE